MTKKVTFATKPKQSAKVVTPDEWVSSGQTERPPTTRFTIDIPTDLHTRIKSHCALRKVKMKEEIQALLEKHFPLS
jgi:hypothetical protein